MESESAVAELKPHSRMGMISLALALLIPLVICILVGLMYLLMPAVFLIDDPANADLSVFEGGVAIVGLSVGLCVFASPLVLLVAFVLGVIGYQEQGTNNMFPIFGMVMSGFFLLLACGCLTFSLLVTFLPLLAQSS